MAANSGIIIEIAVVGAGSDARPMPFALQQEGVYWPWPASHYWRIRYIEDGEQVDQEHLIARLQEIELDARGFASSGETVVWRYYETGI